MQCATKPRITELNPHLLCVLCGGYFVDATAIVECLHSFCKSCIVRYLETHKYCPICDVLVHKASPLQNIRPDKILQSIVYKLVPNLYESEMCKRRTFYSRIQPQFHPIDNTAKGEITEESLFFTFNDTINLSLEYVNFVDDQDYYYVTSSSKRYLRCQGSVKIKNLRHLVSAKYNLINEYEIRFSYNGKPLPESITMLDLAYISSWKRIGFIRLLYQICEVRRTIIKVENKPPVTSDSEQVQSTTDLQSVIVHDQIHEEPKMTVIPATNTETASPADTTVSSDKYKSEDSIVLAPSHKQDCVSDVIATNDLIHQMKKNISHVIKSETVTKSHIAGIASEKSSASHIPVPSSKPMVTNGNITSKRKMDEPQSLVQTKITKTTNSTPTAYHITKVATMLDVSVRAPASTTMDRISRPWDTAKYTGIRQIPQVYAKPNGNRGIASRLPLLKIDPKTLSPIVTTTVSSSRGRCTYTNSSAASTATVTSKHSPATFPYSSQLMNVNPLLYGIYPRRLGNEAVGPSSLDFIKAMSNLYATSAFHPSLPPTIDFAGLQKIGQTKKKTTKAVPMLRCISKKAHTNTVTATGIKSMTAEQSTANGVIKEKSKTNKPDDFAINNLIAFDRVKDVVTHQCTADGVNQICDQITPVSSNGMTNSVSSSNNDEETVKKKEDQ